MDILSLNLIGQVCRRTLRKKKTEICLTWIGIALIGISYGWHEYRIYVDYIGKYLTHWTILVLVIIASFFTVWLNIGSSLLIGLQYVTETAVLALTLSHIELGCSLEIVFSSGGEDSKQEEIFVDKLHKAQRLLVMQKNLSKVYGPCLMLMCMIYLLFITLLSYGSFLIDPGLRLEPDKDRFERHLRSHLLLLPIRLLSGLFRVSGSVGQAGGCGGHTWEDDSPSQEGMERRHKGFG